MYERTINLIGMENFQKIQKQKILLVGCGGVGSFAFMALIRSGIKDITIIDKDNIELSNMNRQLLANLNTIDQAKVDVATKMAHDLNKDINVKGLKVNLQKDNIYDLLDTDYDYIIDACDTLKTKVELIRFASNYHIKIISSMGMGNRVDASKIKITTLDKTYGDPLAKKLRELLKKEHLSLKIKVVFSEEKPIKKGAVDSLITSPSIAGLLISNYIINDIIKVY